jgi:hypothetical protein
MAAEAKREGDEHARGIKEKDAVLRKYKKAEQDIKVVRAKREPTFGKTLLTAVARLNQNFLASVNRSCICSRREIIWSSFRTVFD